MGYCSCYGYADIPGNENTDRIYAYKNQDTHGFYPNKNSYTDKNTYSIKNINTNHDEYGTANL